MSWSPEHYPQTGEAVVSDLDGVVHGDHHGIGLRLWRNIASSGLWDGHTNRNGMNGSEAAEAFAGAVPDDAGFSDLDALGHEYLFDFVQISRPPIALDPSAYQRILHETVWQVARGYAHDAVVDEITDTIGRSGRPGVFITNSPLTPATVLTHMLFPRVPTIVLSPFDVALKGDSFGLKVATPEVRINKGACARSIMADLNIDRSQTVGYGDTESDIRLFDELARPIAINPTAGLRAYAERRGIEIRELLRS